MDTAQNPDNNFKVWLFAVFLFVLLAIIALLFLLWQVLGINLKPPSFKLPSFSTPSIMEKIIPKEKITEEDLSKLHSECYHPYEIKYNSEQNKQIALAYDIFDFSKLNLTGWIGFMKSMGIFDPKELMNKPPREELAVQLKTYFENLINANTEVLNCYIANLSKYPQSKRRMQELLIKEQNLKEEIINFDYQDLVASKLPAEMTISLKPKEQKRFRLRTFCVDSSAYPPSSGTLYLPGGRVEEFKNTSYCKLLREGSRDQDPTEIQNQIWDLEGQKKAASVVKDESLENMINIWEAKKANKISVLGYGANTVTDLDIDLTNLTEENLNLDLSCSYFIPAMVPLDLINDKISSAKISNGSVLGYSASIGGGSLIGLDIDAMNETHIAQSGMGAQAMGSVGKVGQSPPEISKVPDPSRLDEADDRKMASDNLDKAWQDFQDMPTVQTLEDLLESIEACKIMQCFGTSAVEQLGREYAAKVIDKYVGDYYSNPDDAGVTNAVEGFRMCDLLGCDSSDLVKKFDQKLRDELKKKQADEIRKKEEDRQFLEGD